MPSPLRPVFWTLPLAFALWFFTFALPFGNFWFKLSLSASVLALLGLKWSRNHWRTLFCFKLSHLWLGPLSAILLYGIFWLGKEFSTLLFPFASKEISNVYFNRTQLSLPAIGFLLFFIMGPAEEIYWHGFVQRSLTERLGPAAGLLLTAAVYSLVHIVALNFILLLAAALCGLFWGWLYQREQSLIPVILSHSIWDVIIFVIFPLS
ncbi:MAG TPA: type II CAAX endopeptidase family protein [Thermodesulfobacteriota bacterium]|nr:type II CAAX endopeptidase family protein [Thermodesulfobacteriota bacterium]